MFFIGSSRGSFSTLAERVRSSRMPAAVQTKTPGRAAHLRNETRKTITNTDFEMSNIGHKSHSHEVPLQGRAFNMFGASL